MPESRKNKQHVLLITGAPGIGKTTVIRRAADGLKHKGLRGFYTEEIREDGERRGFRLVGFDGTIRIIAHVEISKRHHVGRYGVDVAVLDDAARLLRPDSHSRVYLVDEIGKMECLSERLRRSNARPDFRTYSDSRHCRRARRRLHCRGQAPARVRTVEGHLRQSR